MGSEELILVRHAHAERDAASSRDIDRPLSTLGFAQAEAAAGWMIERQLRPGRVLCSPALRVRQTLAALQARLPELPVVADDDNHDDGRDDADHPSLSADDRAERRARRLARRRAAREDIWNIPNGLTMARVAMIPVVLWYVDAGPPRDGFVAAWLYGATAVTDLLDGWLARRRNLITIFGKFMDPLADKLLVMALLVYLTRMGRIAPWIVVVLLGREVAVTSLRAIAASEGVVIAAGESGKWKTALQMVGILCLVLHFPYAVLPFWAHPVDLNITGQWLVLLSLVFSVTSGVEYGASSLSPLWRGQDRGRSGMPR